MGRAKKRARTTVNGAEDYVLPLNDEGLVPNGFTISFDDFADDFDHSEDTQKDAPRGGNGSQVLPVAFDLPDDFAGDPEDGSEYLYLVRREAASHPGVIVSEAFMRTQAANGSAEVAITTSTITVNAGPAHRPSEEWRSSILARFKGMRQTFANIESTDKDSLPPHYLPVPAAADESSWKSYINGRKRKSMADTPKENSTSAEPETSPAVTASVDKPNEEENTAPQAGPSRKEQPRPPIPLLMRYLDQNSVINVLDHFNTWLGERLAQNEQQATPSTVFLPAAMLRKRNVKGAPKVASTSIVAALPAAPEKPLPTPLMTALDSQWLFSLLAVCDSLLSPNELSVLRTLAKTCQEVAQATHEALTRYDSRASPAQKQQWQDVITGSWTVVAAVWEVWAQRDLWM